METIERKRPDEIIAEILGRWSVTDLREQTDADLVAGDEKFYSAGSDLRTVRQGKQGIIAWWLISSGPGRTYYEVRRYKNFVFCSCKDFFFKKKVCKHIAFTARVECANCHELPARIGKYCRGCDTMINRFHKPTSMAA